MVHQRIPLRIIAIEAAAFLLTVCVIAADEFLDAPHYLFGTAEMLPRVSEFFFESGVVACLGVGVVLTTVAMLRRIERLESFVVMCAWCRKVRVGNDWVTIEQYLAEHHEQATSHGICETCSKKAFRSGTG